MYQQLFTVKHSEMTWNIVDLFKRSCSWSWVWVGNLYVILAYKKSWPDSATSFASISHGSCSQMNCSNRQTLNEPLLPSRPLTVIECIHTFHTHPFRHSNGWAAVNQLLASLVRTLGRLFDVLAGSGLPVPLRMAIIAVMAFLQVSPQSGGCGKWECFS